MYLVFIACHVELSQATRVSVVVGLHSMGYVNYSSAITSHCLLNLCLLVHFVKCFRICSLCNNSSKACTCQHFLCALVMFVLQSWLLLLPFVTPSHKTDLKSIVSLLRYWHRKKVHKMRLHLLFESSPQRNRQKSYGQLYCGSQVKDIVIVPHFFACGSYRPQRLNTLFVQSLSHFVRFSSR